MKDNYLLIVEGEQTEKNIFEAILKKYGFNVIRKEEKLNIEDFGQFEKEIFSNEKKNVVIVQGPKTRIHDFIKKYKTNTDDIERVFQEASDSFQGIFLLYDVDHNSASDIEEMFDKFPEESGGMLLLSSPCIEVLGENDHQRVLHCNRLKEYKAELNDYYNHNKKYNNVEEYIIDNFEECALYYLEKNYHDFDEPNIMEHPSLIVEEINLQNERVNYSGDRRNDSYVIYRYLTTVVYVFIAFINGLTREIENYEIVKDFFEKRKR